MRIGFGYDSHIFCEGRKLILGGVEIPYERGLQGHSDADVITHAVIDAILGATGQSDIGTLFPDTDSRFKDASSIEMLKEVYSLSLNKGYRLGNCDITVVLEKPKLKNYKESIRENIALVLGVEASDISVKAKTNEGMDSVGEGKGVCAYAAVIMLKI